MNEPLRVLLVEDSEADAELVLQTLRRGLGPLEFERVETAEALTAALDGQSWHIAICDYRLPRFSALAALALVRERLPYLPCIIVSGTIGEETAVEAMKLGADDYVMKNNLARLVPAVKRELAANEVRRRNASADQALRNMLELYRSLADAMPMGLYRTDRQGRVMFFNKYMAATIGARRESDYIGRPIYELALDADVAAAVAERSREQDRLVLDGGEPTIRIEEFGSAESGTKFVWEITRIPVRDSAGIVIGLQGVVRDVTEDKRNEKALVHERQLLQNLMDNIPDMIFFKDRELRYVRLNRALATRYGLTDPANAVGRRSGDFLPREIALKSEREEQEMLETGKGLVDTVYKHVIDASNNLWYSRTEVPIRDEKGEISGLVAIARDITERMSAELRIERLSRVYALLSAVNALIVRVRDRDELFREACRIAVETGQLTAVHIAMLDPESDQLLLAAASNTDPQYLETLREDLKKLAPDNLVMRDRLFTQQQPLVVNDVEAESSYVGQDLSRMSGTRSLCVLPIVIAGKVAGLLSLRAREPQFFDADELKLLTGLAGDIAFAIEHIDKSEKLDYLAYYDPLTGLANARLFHERLVQQLRAAQGRQAIIALALIDLERFKNVNDALGRQAGDALLKQLAGRLTTRVRGSDEIAHLGADHFALVLSTVKDADEVAHVIEDYYHACFGAAFSPSGTEFKAGARMGIALYPDDGGDAEALFRNAEAALKKAKTGGERYLFYSAKMTERVAERLALENKLRQALEREEFVLHYQPKISSDTGRIVGAEALIRWNAPDTGLVPPGEFITLLEETGLILEVGAWALRQAVKDQGRWRELGHEAPRVAVNVSAIQLRQNDFVEVVRQSVSAGPESPDIDLEITESLIMADIEGNVAKLQALRDLGFNIAIDDFGTGYSSLAYLARLPVATIKIDRSFVITMLKESNTMTLVSTIISLAHSLGFIVVAEGVDQEEQAKMLRLLRCDQMQGYLFSPPLPFDEMAALIAGEPGRAGATGR